MLTWSFVCACMFLCFFFIRGLLVAVCMFLCLLVVRFSFVYCLFVFLSECIMYSDANIIARVRRNKRSNGWGRTW